MADGVPLCGPVTRHLATRQAESAPAIRGIVDAMLAAKRAGDPVLYSRTDALLRHVRSLGTSFGFLPEVHGVRLVSRIDPGKPSVLGAELLKRRQAETAR